VAVELSPGRRVIEPLVDSVAAFAQRLLDAVVRPGDESIQRHGDIRNDLPHRHLLLRTLAGALYE